MNAVQVVLFGKFHIRFNGAELTGMEGRKTQELLAYLLVYRSRAHAREVLAETLWGESERTQTRKYLRQALWQVQSALEPCAGDGGQEPLVADPEWVQFNPVSPVWLDVAQFEDAYARTQGVAGAALDDPAVEAMSDAVKLYTGDLLEGCYQDWCIFERERLQNMYLAMLDKLIDWCQVREEYEVGLGYGEQILRYDRARERTHRRMMRLYYLAGDRTSALRQYEQLVRTLREELNVRPSRRSMRLVEQIRADTFDGDPPSGGVGADKMAPPRGRTNSDPRAHLRHLHESLTAMQRQIRQELEVIELALADS
ncbi:MAG: BTAD domain-containing putative transcriptional regulator [Caldilineales bacterium]